MSQSTALQKTAFLTPTTALVELRCAVGKGPRAAYTVLEHQEVVDENLASLITAEYEC